MARGLTDTDVKRFYELEAQQYEKRLLQMELLK
jgi:hypothetical protein